MTMETTAQLPPKALASARLSARRRKARSIRRSVVAFAVGAFIAAWGLIYGQMATGNDPALTAKATHNAKHSATRSTSSTSSRTQTSSTSSNTITPSPVTTSQS